MSNSCLFILCCSNQRIDPGCGLSRVLLCSSRSEFLAVSVHRSLNVPGTDVCGTATGENLDFHEDLTL